MTITILIQHTDNPIRDFFENSTIKESAVAFSQWPIVSLLRQDRLLLDILIGISSLTILLSVFGLLSTSYRSFRPLLWLYLLIITIVTVSQLAVVSYIILKTNDTINIGWKLWTSLNPSTRIFIEEGLDCCSYQNVATEYGKAIPENCLKRTVILSFAKKSYGLFKKILKSFTILFIDERIREALKRPCVETITDALKVNQTPVIVIVSTLISIECLQIIACFILLATRLPYNKHRQLNGHDSNLISEMIFQSLKLTRDES